MPRALLALCLGCIKSTMALRILRQSCYTQLPHYLKCYLGLGNNIYFCNMGMMMPASVRLHSSLLFLFSAVLDPPRASAPP